ncbi:MAG: T9SS type A sorting domain-containing protein [Crocinitomicaceae bacterium]|nr:T9SS type A sorting domain-containing protein [Crocinitomicaceae bacterium]
MKTQFVLRKIFTGLIFGMTSIGAWAFGNGCTDPLACNYDPAAVEDDGQCIYGNCIEGDNPWNAIALSLTNLGICSSISGSLEGATPSAIVQSEFASGEDIWYSFVPQTKGVRIEVGSSVSDIIIELVNHNYEAVASLNLRSGIGGEVLNFGSLSIGEMYYVAVRNVNSNLGNGAFTICAQNIKSSECIVPAEPLESLCELLKTGYCGVGVSYTFRFVPQSDPTTVYTRTQTSNLLLMANISGLRYNSDYTVSTVVNYQLPNSLGYMETVQVNPSGEYQLSTGDYPRTELISADRCSTGSKSIYSYVKAEYLCDATDYKWCFEEMNNDMIPTGLPIIKFAGSATNQIKLNQVPQLRSGKTYRVKIAPVFGGLGGPGKPGTVGDYGPFQYICTIGAAMSLFDEEKGLNNEFNYKSEIHNIQASVYPNPNTGENFMVKFKPNDHSNVVTIKMFDSVGRVVFNEKFSFDGELTTNLNLHREVVEGIYIIEFATLDEVISERIIIEK